MISRSFIFSTLLLIAVCPVFSETRPGGLEALTSPILFEGDHKFAYRDPAAVYHEGTFFLYFTLVENHPENQRYYFTALSKSVDLIHWTYPRIITPRDLRANNCSPGNVIRFQGQWVLCLQSYPTPNGEPIGTKASRIFIMRSDDLENWSDPELLRVKGNDVPVGEMGRMIDPYLLEDMNEPGKWWCYYKQNGVSMSYSYDLVNWTYAGHHQAGENVTVLKQAEEYVMFHSPKNGIGVKRSRSPQVWGDDVDLLMLGQAGWPWAAARLTAATVVDLTDNPAVGKYIMFFHGARPGPDILKTHGEASLGIAWSEDLKNWDWPGKE